MPDGKLQRLLLGRLPLLLELAVTDLFKARWSNRIHEEWMRNLLRNRPDLPLQQLEQTRDLMNAHVRDCLVEGFEGLEETILLPDPDDRHLVAAAIKGRADVIVTFNLSDFPASALEPWELEAQHPDEFLANLIDFGTGPGGCRRENVPPAIEATDEDHRRIP